MLSPEEVARHIEQIYALDKWLASLPLNTEFRERTTFRQFRAGMEAKKLELGLTPQVMEQLHAIEGNAALDAAFLEWSMTMDVRELIGPSYFDDLPLNYYWMPEYEGVIRAVDEYMEQQPLYKSVSHEVLAGVVQKYMGARETPGPEPDEAGTL